jgi:hypothetical protein
MTSFDTRSTRGVSEGLLISCYIDTYIYLMSVQLILPLHFPSVHNELNFQDRFDPFQS